LPSLHDVNIDIGRPHCTHHRRLIQRLLRLSRRRPASVPGRGPHNGSGALIAEHDLQILLLSQHCVQRGLLQASIRPATEFTLFLFASADGATSKWVFGSKPLSASEILGVIMCGECH
jgi:hypothetical protein